VNEVAGLIARGGPQPLHAQIAARFAEFIADGRWPLHHQLPSEVDLAAQLDVSRGTVRRALQTLTEAGLIVTVQGKGTFVVGQSGVDQAVVQEVFSLAEGLQRQGIEFTTEVRSADGITADESFQSVLEPAEGGRLMRLVRRRSIGGIWVAYLVDYVRTDICPGIERFDFEQRLVFDVIERDYGLELDWGTRTYGAEAANEVIARELEIPLGSPILYQEQLTHLSDSRAVEYSQVWIRADRLRVSILLRHEQSRSSLPIEAVP